MGKYTPAPTFCPADCWDWLTEEQFADLARQAYRFAQHLATPPEGQPWRDLALKRPGYPVAFQCWSHREAFADHLIDTLTGGLNVHAHASGLKGYADLAKRHSSWMANVQFGGAV